MVHSFYIAQIDYIARQLIALNKVQLTKKKFVSLKKIFWQSTIDIWAFNKNKNKLQMRHDVREGQKLLRLVLGYEITVAQLITLCKPVEKKDSLECAIWQMTVTF